MLYAKRQNALSKQEKLKKIASVHSANVTTSRYVKRVGKRNHVRLCSTKSVRVL